MSEGFEVDLGALRQAADGVRRASASPGALPPPTGADAVGHDRLADAVAEFLTRWERGVTDLVADAQAAGDVLSAAAEAYERVDVAGARAVDGILRADVGPDPAAPR